MKIAVVTSGNAEELSNDDPIFLDALRRAGHEPFHYRWDQPAPWGDMDLAVLRSTWDYYERPDEFRAWMKDVRHQVRLENPFAVLEWNFDKRYLLDLAGHGVAVVPTRIAEDSDAAWQHAEQFWQSGADVIIKPVVSGGSWGLHHLGPGQRAPLDPKQAPYLVQPFLPAVCDKGELSLIYIGGGYSHAIRKIPKAGDIRVQKEFGADYNVEEACTEARALAAAALAASPGPLLYARVDVIEDEGELKLMELELFEPELFFVFVPQAADRLVKAIAGIR